VCARAIQRHWPTSRSDDGAAELYLTSMLIEAAAGLTSVALAIAGVAGGTDLGAGASKSARRTRGALRPVSRANGRETAWARAMYGIVPVGRCPTTPIDGPDG
jgi:hypothetical protein